MRRWMQLAACLYPRQWRSRYGEEFAALIEGYDPGWREFADLIRGAIFMQITRGSGYLRVIGALALAGAVAAAASSFIKPQMYVSSAVLRADIPRRDLQKDPNIGNAMLAASALESCRWQVLSRSYLIILIREYDLYGKERQRMPLEDVVVRLSRDIHISHVDDAAAAAVRIDFAYPDKDVAKRVVTAVTAEFVKNAADVNPYHQTYWTGMAEDHPEILTSGPRPILEGMEVVRAANLPENPAGPRRLAFAAVGFGAGLLAGLLAVFVWSCPKRALWLAVSSAGGIALALGVSLLLPDAYVSTAALAMMPPVLPELQPEVTAESLNEDLRQVVREATSPESLAKIIQAPRLDLYKEERARKPLAEVVEQMRGRDLVIHFPKRRAPSDIPVITISFSYHDPRKAQAALIEIVTRIIRMDYNIAWDRVKDLKRGNLVRDLVGRHLGATLEVFEAVGLPSAPARPNRLAFGATGLGIGLLLGTLGWWLQQSRTQKQQAA
jgi:hypothetical protein